MEGFKLSVPLKIGARPVVGRNFRQQLEFIGDMSVVTGKIEVPVFIGSSFVHPSLFTEENFEQNLEKQIKKLEKNAETTVATVDYSLNKIISLADAGNIVGKYDVEICWMAVEAGIEDVIPKNMTFKNQQILQWGIPGKLSMPGNFDYAELKEGDAENFEKSVMEEMQWLDDNKGILRPDSDLQRNNGINNSVKTQADYILKNGIKIYGLRITGPSNELLKLAEDIDIRTMSVVDMDFWNW